VARKLKYLDVNLFIY